VQSSFFFKYTLTFDTISVTFWFFGHKRNFGVGAEGSGNGAHFGVIVGCVDC